ncbi:addiction module antidote protein [Fundidesulfovibrio putealis]|uniref:addiction module antidote protein n=1 Tax=Fundidesulfovibrio putealis TaxID=270496 RepID=UPI000486B120|nr:addiction module antidote protein [Fundidesulfovibrio putealis]
MNSATKASVSHHDAVVAELRDDPELAVEYLKATLEEDDEVALRIGLRRLAQAYGVQEIADKAGLRRENLYRALSPKGNPTVKTLTSILRALGLRLSVERAHDKAGAH